MIFTRSVISVSYTDYTRYRPFLRADFRYRCAYCLRHEGHNGGEANFCIDHHRPIRGPHGNPDLVNSYANLYYACCECNENKADTWPTEDEQQRGYRFLNPCLPDDDHDLHLRCHPDGTLEPLTNAGRYTNIMLVLWRPQLRYWRARMFRLQERLTEIERDLLPLLNAQAREELARELQEIRAEIEPPVFDRPRGAARRINSLDQPPD